MRRGDSAQLRTLYDKIMSQNAPDCISLHIHFRKIFGGRGGDMPPEPPGSLWCAHSGLLPQTKKRKILDRTLAGA